MYNNNLDVNMLVTLYVIYVRKEGKEKGRKEGREGRWKGRRKKVFLFLSFYEKLLISVSLLITANWQLTKQNLQTYHVLDSFASLQN